LPGRGGRPPLTRLPAAAEWNFPGPRSRRPAERHANSFPWKQSQQLAARTWNEVRLSLRRAGGVTLPRYACGRLGPVDKGRTTPCQKITYNDDQVAGFDGNSL
jgi:hypothetical protein